LKDSNAKTREGAYKLLLEMAKVHDDHADFIKLVGAALGSKTPHMRSAAVTALSRLVFEFSSEDYEVQQLLPSMIKTVLLLSDDPAREVTKSMVIFVRVTVSAATSDQLEPLLPDILTGLLKYHRGKDRFRAKIKIIIKKLVKLFGYDALMPHVPPSDTRLLTHMRKLSEREARRKHAQRSGRGRQSQRSDRDEFDAMMDSDEEDSDDGRTLMTGMTGTMTRVSRMSRVTSRSGKQTLKRGRAEMDESIARSTKSGRSRKASVSFRIKNDADGEVLDVKELTQKTVSFADDRSGDSSDDDGVDLEFDASGKLVVPDVDDSFSTENNNDGDTEMSFSKLSKLQRSSGRSDQSTVHSQQSKKTKNASVKPGSAYKAKKAGGDVKKKGQKYEPYAYVQLDGRHFSRKNRRHAVEQMGSVVHRTNKRQKR
jgi:ribosomal RNA-processing protein 12